MLERSRRDVVACRLAEIGFEGSSERCIHKNCLLRQQTSAPRGGSHPPGLDSSGQNYRLRWAPRPMRRSAKLSKDSLRFITTAIVQIAHIIHQVRCFSHARALIVTSTTWFRQIIISSRTARTMKHGVQLPPCRQVERHYEYTIELHVSVRVSGLLEWKYSCTSMHLFTCHTRTTTDQKP